MRLYAMIGMYLFIVGALLSIFDGLFIAAGASTGLIYVLLIFTGVFAGLLNISEDEEHHFLLSSVAFIVIVEAFRRLFSSTLFLESVVHFFTNAEIFIGSMALVVALKTILEFGSQNYRVSLMENIQERTEEIIQDHFTKKERQWNFIVFLAVAATFLIILLNMPFYTLTTQMRSILNAVEWLVIFIFIIDLFVLFRREPTIGSFLQNCWVDIIAAVPISGIFRTLKIVRLARIARVARVARATHSMKFFSKKSGMKTYLNPGRRTEDIEITENPRAPVKPTPTNNPEKIITPPKKKVKKKRR